TQLWCPQPATRTSRPVNGPHRVFSPSPHGHARSRSGREERGWSGSLRPVIRHVLLLGELAKPTGLPGRPSGLLARASGWLITVGRARAIAGTVAAGGVAARGSACGGYPGQARVSPVVAGWPALVGDVCGPAVEVGAGEGVQHGGGQVGAGDAARFGQWPARVQGGGAGRVVSGPPGGGGAGPVGDRAPQAGPPSAPGRVAGARHS